MGIVTRGYKISQLDEEEETERQREEKQDKRRMPLGLAAAGLAVHRQPKKTSGEQMAWEPRTRENRCHSPFLADNGRLSWRSSIGEQEKSRTNRSRWDGGEDVGGLRVQAPINYRPRCVAFAGAWL